MSEGTGGANRESFEHLLEGFLNCSGAKDDARDLKAIEQVLQGFVTEAAKAGDASRKQSLHGLQAVRSTLERYQASVASYRQGQELVADDFNFLSVLELTSNELRHTMMLAWLLDREPDRAGTHAQGALGFRRFLEELNLPAWYGDLDYWTRREVAGSESRVDLEIACRGRFLIHIECKVKATEGVEQTQREWADLNRRAVELGVSSTHQPTAAIHAFFLTPDGTRPASPHFSPISWDQVARVLERFANLAKPPEVRLFAAHYARTLRRFVVQSRMETSP